MSYRLTIALSAIAFTLIAGSASAQDSFGLFKALCLETDGDVAQVQAAASGDGWTDLAPNRLEELTALTETVNPWSRTLRTPNGSIIVLAGLTRDSDSQMESRVCDVLIFSRNPPDISDQIEAWVGMPSIGVRGGVKSWAYEVSGGRRVAPSDTRSFSAAYSIFAVVQPTFARYELIRTAPVN